MLGGHLRKLDSFSWKWLTEGSSPPLLCCQVEVEVPATGVESHMRATWTRLAKRNSKQGRRWQKSNRPDRPDRKRCWEPLHRFGYLAQTFLLCCVRKCYFSKAVFFCLVLYPLCSFPIKSTCVYNTHAFVSL